MSNLYIKMFISTYPPINWWIRGYEHFYIQIAHFRFLYKNVHIHVSTNSINETRYRLGCIVAFGARVFGFSCTFFSLYDFSLDSRIQVIPCQRDQVRQYPIRILHAHGESTAQQSGCPPRWRPFHWTRENLQFPRGNCKFSRVQWNGRHRGGHPDCWAVLSPCACSMRIGYCLTWSRWHGITWILESREKSYREKKVHEKPKTRAPKATMHPRRYLVSLMELVDTWIWTFLYKKRKWAICI